MNHQNMMHQFFDPQQANMNGYSGASNFQSNQQNSSSFNGPTPSSNPYMSNPNFRQQNGVSRFGSGSDNENFDGMQSPSSNQQNQQQGFPNFVDPRMGGFDSRTRPNFDPMSGGMHGFASNKMRMNDMALFNPAAMAAFQRQRMGMFPQGRENVSMCLVQLKVLVIICLTTSWFRNSTEILRMWINVGHVPICFIFHIIFKNKRNT